MSRIVSRNGQTWDYPGRTRGAEGRKKSGHMTAKNLVYDCGFPDGAKRIRTADPLHAMQLVSTSESPCNDSKIPSTTGLSQELPLKLL